MPLAVGSRLGPYEIVGPLGAGGMGEVYRARDSRLGREVAIKILPERLANDPEALQRFTREARAVAALSHPNILSIYDFGTADGVVFAVMELLEGENLRSRLARSALPWRKGLEIGVALAEGLSAAHSQGIVHRDLKPENIFLTADGRVKILDFGLAQWKLATPAQGESWAPTEFLDTDPGTVLGTIGYMSPEQVRGDSADPRSDIFSLGCALYEMVAGHRAFSRPTAAETMTAILNEDPPEIKDSAKHIPPELGAVLAHCLEKSPQERFHSAHDLAFALRAILRGSAISKATPVSRRRSTIDSLAVLPFLNASGDPNAEYLSDGITESLINGLSQLPKIRVTARSTAFRYKSRDVDPEAVGRELNVRALLMGRVVQRGDALSIQADLVDVSDGSQLWGERYNRRLSDIFEIEEEIAQQISEKLRMKLTGDQKTRLAKRQTQNTEAYQLYLKGRYHWNKRTEEGIQKGAEYFQQAIQKDPTYALAYVGLADVYAVRGIYSDQPAREAYEKMKAIAVKALEIDPTLVEAHASLACVKMMSDWKWREAEEEFKRAIELNPNYTLAHHWYAHDLEIMGRLDEAVSQIKQGLESDPLSITLNAHLGQALYYARRYDDASEQLHKTLEIDPNFVNAHLLLVWVYLQKAMYVEAIASAKKTIEISPGATFATATLARAYARSGNRGEAETLLGRLLDLARGRYVPSYHIAMIYVDLGDKDQAFQWLEQAREERAPFLLFAKVDPCLDSLRPDPRFRDLLRRIGLET